MQVWLLNQYSIGNRFAHGRTVSVVVVAETEESARLLASVEDGYSSTWVDAGKSSCEPVDLGTAEVILMEHI